MFQAFMSLLIVSFHRHFGPPLGRILHFNNCSDVSSLLLPCPYHSNLRACVPNEIRWFTRFSVSKVLRRAYKIVYSTNTHNYVVEALGCLAGS